MIAETPRALLIHPPAFIGTTPAEVIGASDHNACLAAAQTSCAHAFISELPEGYHTRIGDGGVVLTVSQRRQLSTAALIAAGPSAHARCAAAGAAPSVPDVPKDLALPSLGLLLDPCQMADLLGRTLRGREDGEGPTDVRVHSVRYKPGESVVVQYGVRTPSGWVTAVAYSRAGSKLRRKHKKPVNRKLARRVADRVPATRPFDHLPELPALVQWLPLDVRLPLLADTAQRISERLAKKGIDAAGAEPELLRYWPRRRAVLRVGPHILKVYRDLADFDQARSALRASAALTRVHTPAYEGRLKARQVTVQEWVPGHTPSLWPAASEAAGEVLADLHHDSVEHLPTTTPDDILEKTAGRAEFVTHLVPELRSDVAVLLRDLEQRAPYNAGLATSHGNFHAGQLLAGPAGLTVLDVDRMCRAAPAFDLASFATHLVFGRPGDLEVLGAAVDSLVAGYGSRPTGLDWYLATCLLRRAAVPFRFQDQNWSAAASELVSLAREVLR